MERKSKEMIFGAAIVVSLVVIFIPYILNGQLRLGSASINIPDAPVWPNKQKLVPQPKEMADFKAQKLEPRPAQTVLDKDKAWVVSAGDYASRQEAEKWVKAWQTKQLPAYLKIDPNQESGTKYRVLIGPKVHKNEATDIVKQLKQENIKAELKVYHPNMAFD